MNKTVVYFIIFLVLGGITAWMLMEEKKDEKTSLVGEDRKFAVEDASEIQKIFIADRNRHTTTLERNGDHWIYNGQYKARPNAMENLLDAITRVQIKYQPPAKAIKHMISSLATEGIKVEIYNKKNDLIKAYYVGGSTSDERGTFMMMADAEQPYVTNIPNWSGNIRFRYNLKGDDWRENIIFAAKTEEIKSVFINYPKQRNKSFRINQDGGKFAISPFYEITPKKNQEAAQGKVEQFLINFESVSSRGFDNFNIEKDSISASIPFVKIGLEKTNGKTAILDLYPIMPKQQFDDKTGQPIPLGEIENYYALLNEEDFIVVSQKIIQNLLWAYDYFYE